MATIRQLFTICLLACLSFFTSNLNAQDLAADSLALVDLYNQCGGENWDGFESWFNGPLSTWRDVTVDSATQRVTHVEFINMSLVGTLPSSLGNLDQMSGKIQLNGHEGLTGELPAFLWNWVNVERFQVKFCGYTSIDVTGMENMVNLTEFNSENTPIAGMVPAVIFELPAMDKLYLHDSEYDALPPNITSISGYTRLYLNGNNLTEIPDMSGITWGDGAKIRVHNNKLDFEDLEPNVSIQDQMPVEEFRYSPQMTTSELTFMYPDVGDTVRLDATIPGSQNVYIWLDGDDEIVAETAIYEIESFDPAVHSGKYYSVAQSTLVPGLDIVSEPVYLYQSPLIQDSIALADLYNNNGGNTWEGYDTWLNGPIADWEGVTVDSATQRVVGVDFRDMHLTGTLQETLGNLTEISSKIEFRDDTLLVGALPSFLWNWTKVERFQLKFSGITSIETDGVEKMVNLTEFNTEGSPIEGMVPAEFFMLPSMQKLYFHDGEYDALPPEMVTTSGLDRLYLNGNNLTELPDMSNIVWAEGAKIRVHNNHLTFEDLEDNIVLTMDTLVEEFRYSPQAKVGEMMTLMPEPGSEVTLQVPVGGSENVYSWIKGEDLVGEGESFVITSFDEAVDAGTYYVVVQSPLVPGLDIVSHDIVLLGNAASMDSLALVDLYNFNGGETWVGYDSWLNGPIDTWEGVTVDSLTRRVVGVDFRDMHLIGTLQESLGNLTELSSKVEFRDDSLLVGALPSFLWNWTKVERFQLKFSGITSIETEGVEKMVNLTEFNTEGSPIEGMVPGAFFTLPSMVKLYFHDGNYDALPPELLTSSGLDRLYLNGNNLTDLPDMSGIVWGDGAKVRVHDNFLTFEDLESNVVITQDTLVEEFRYSPQANVGDSTALDLDTGDTLAISVNVGGSSNVYTWIKGEDMVVEGAEEATLQIDSVTTEDSGSYFALVQSPLVPGLDIFSEPTTVSVAPPSGLVELTFDGLKIYGNPVGEKVRIQSEEVIGKVSVFNAAGQLVFRQSYNAKDIQLNLGHLHAGLYHIMLQDDQKYQTISVVKK
ncbi:T9SS type A sorting domain-containing protein [Portibacter marinus]|uniref:T9SS type A sorting domain-containing protein n=1 Tax=Portibacter marinus TaxID=2898660 RepID=UPI001F22E66D|nr:T9SS type A sorting domain-containing protein [Portibacter marinus]